jgi:hypothetical protein
LSAPADRPHRSLDYLLEDDEESKSNKGIIFLCLLALLLVVGLGWLRWRNVGLPDWFKKQTSSLKTTAPAAPASSETTPASETSSSSQPVSPPEGTSTTAPSDSSSPPPSPSITPIESSGATANAPPPPATAEDSKTATSPASTKGAAETSEPVAKEKPEDAPPRSDAAKAKTAPPKPAPKAATKAPDQVTLAEQYLYGRGVPQNCERGLRLVKPAAEQSNPKAMITMGALYATGHCLSRDLPTAYRFFALALRNDPENGPLRQNAEMVWKQMTAEERKQAIRMTQ